MLAGPAHWGEAQGLTPERVRNQLATLVNTKGKRARFVPIAPELESRIQQHFKQHGPFQLPQQLRQDPRRLGSQTPRRSVLACAAIYVCQPLCHERREHPDATEDLGAYLVGHDHALYASSPGYLQDGARPVTMGAS